MAPNDPRLSEPDGSDGTDLDDPTVLVSRHGAVLPADAVRRERNTLIVVGILFALVAAAVVGFLVLRNNDDDSADSNVVATDTTIATDASLETDSVPLESIAPDTALDTVPPAAPPATVDTPTPSTQAGSIGSADTAALPSRTGAAVSPAASPSIVSTPAPGEATPLADAIATASRSSTFGPYLAMVEAAGLTTELRTLKNVTILAPTESAFSALPVDVQVALRSPSNRAALVRIVRYSLLSGRRTAAQLTPGTYATAEGSPVTVQAVNGAIRVNDATVTGPDVKVADGVLHAIDRLLIPPSVDLNTLANVPKPATPGAATTTAPGTTFVPVTTAAATPTNPATTVVPPVTASATTAPVVATTAPVVPTVASTSPATAPPTAGAPSTASTTVPPTTRPLNTPTTT